MFNQLATTIKKSAAAIALCALVVVSLPHSAQAHSYSYFDMDETYSSDSRAFTKWNTMLARFEEQKKVSVDKCGQVEYVPCTVKQWTGFLDTQRGKPLEEQINAVNNYVNSFPYVTDEANWGGKDFWETPYEFFTVSGNCKDYAITKYFSLRALGVPAKSMRLIVLQDLNLGGAIHAVLGVNVNGRLVILDNQIKQVVSAMSIYHYRPIYAINEAGWWRLQPRDEHSTLPRVMEASNSSGSNNVASGGADNSGKKETTDNDVVVVEKSNSIKASGHAG